MLIWWYPLSTMWCILWPSADGVVVCCTLILSTKPCISLFGQKYNVKKLQVAKACLYFLGDSLETCVTSVRSLQNISGYWSIVHYWHTKQHRSKAPYLQLVFRLYLPLYVVKKPSLVSCQSFLDVHASLFVHFAKAVGSRYITLTTCFLVSGCILLAMSCRFLPLDATEVELFWTHSRCVVPRIPKNPSKEHQSWKGAGEIIFVRSAATTCACRMPLVCWEGKMHFQLPCLLFSVFC